MTVLPASQRPVEHIEGNTNTGLLKTLALLFMITDHCGKIFFSGGFMGLPSIPELRLIGRLAFPLYCWCLVVGVTYTRSIGKYALRLLLVGILSQPLYVVALHHVSLENLTFLNMWQSPNIYFTLLAALLGLYGMKLRRYGSQWIGPLLAMVLASWLRLDYGWKGVLFIQLLYLVKGDRRALAAVWVAFSLFWGSTSSVISQVFGRSIPYSAVLVLSDILRAFLHQQGLVILALPLVYFPLKSTAKMPKWLGYSAYPLHLLLIGVVEWIVTGSFY